ncbi:MAG: ATP-dependent helicase [Deltaproteobacteria bacterium]|nr:ATP-dependent helicase [Deltaproteobacteria bacterium]
MKEKNQAKPKRSGTAAAAKSAPSRVRTDGVAAPGKAEGPATKKPLKRESAAQTKSVKAGGPATKKSVKAVAAVAKKPEKTKIAAQTKPGKTVGTAQTKPLKAGTASVRKPAAPFPELRPKVTAGSRAEAVAEPGWLAELSPDQLKAVRHEGGPLLVLAGAGSGKTRTLASRVAWLISRGEEPSRILLLTFTRKAAAEMLERCRALVGPAANGVKGGTFHSVATSILRTESGAIGWPRNFDILDRNDSLALLGRAVEGAGKDGKGMRAREKGRILQILGVAANTGASVRETVTKRFRDFVTRIDFLEKIDELYSVEKRKASAMDFDDLLAKFSEALKDETVRRRVAGRFDHVLVDEYQDTSPVQATITRQLTRDHLNVTAVGDAAQSIYGFRGADVGNVLEFSKLFAPATVMRLELNYRSTSGILTMANRVMKGGMAGYALDLKAARGKGEVPKQETPWDCEDEAQVVSVRIRQLISEGTDPGDIAVLFRNAGYARDLEGALTRRGIAYEMRGGLKLMDKAHVRDYLAFLKVAANPPSDLNLRRVLEMLPGTGKGGAAKAAQWVAEEPARLARLGEAPLRKSSREAAGRLGELFSALCTGSDAIGNRPGLVLDYYEPLVESLYKDYVTSRVEDVRTVASLAGAFLTLSEFLESLALDPPDHLVEAAKGGKGGKAGKDGGNKVILSTIHSAKGLEWPHVFIVSAVEGRLPFFACQDDPAMLEEERRLMYVAVTRARDTLCITSPRMVFAGGFEEYASLSRFIRS